MRQVEQTKLEERLRRVFPKAVVYKCASQQKLFASLSIPPYLRDWLVQRFAGDDGQVDVEQARSYIERYLPGRKDWEHLKQRMIDGEPIRFLAKVTAQVDVSEGVGLFELPDLSFPKRQYEAVIDLKLLQDEEKREALLGHPEAWGVVELIWRVMPLRTQKEQGRCVMVDFKPFRPYRVDLGYYRQAREAFSTEEWIDVLLMGMDYNPSGFASEKQKLAMLCRLLPFVEPRLNLMELAPKGTGKSYVFSQLSKYGWLLSGGIVTRAKLFYDMNRRQQGLVARYDYVALDEIQTIKLQEESEVRGALKGYMESGEYRVGNQEGVGQAGIVLLGNIEHSRMDENKDLLAELPSAFRESALIDRFHGFLKGWDIPRMHENLKATGWALNTEFFSEILHALRTDIGYRALVDDLVVVPRGADTRDTEAIKRLACGLLKLLFPNAVERGVELELFGRYCLEPAKAMRQIIRTQLSMMDGEYYPFIPDIVLRLPLP